MCGAGSAGIDERVGGVGALIKSQRMRNMDTIAKCLAGHHLDADAGKKRNYVEPKYDNCLRDWILLVIAEAKAKQNMTPCNDPTQRNNGIEADFEPTDM